MSKVKSATSSENLNQATENAADVTNVATEKVEKVKKEKVVPFGTVLFNNMERSAKLNVSFIDDSFVIGNFQIGLANTLTIPEDIRILRLNAEEIEGELLEQISVLNGHIHYDIARNYPTSTFDNLRNPMSGAQSSVLLGMLKAECKKAIKARKDALKIEQDAEKARLKAEKAATKTKTKTKEASAEAVPQDAPQSEPVAEVAEPVATTKSKTKSK